MHSQPPQIPSGYPPGNRPPSQPPRKAPIPTSLIVFAILGTLFFAIGPLSVMAIYGMRKYLANAKTVEARNVLGQLARDAVRAYERDGRVCPTASQRIPSNTSSVQGKKYASSAGEWSVDESRRAGFACLGFSMNQPQYFQYSYRGGDEVNGGFIAEAHGDLNGDGQLSMFRISGVLRDGELVVAPTLEEVDPQE